MRTNKEFRDDLAKELWAKYQKRNEQLGQVNQLPISAEIKESAKKEIEENFSREYHNIKARPWYVYARKTHLDEIKSKFWMEKAKKKRDALQMEYEWLQNKYENKIENANIELSSKETDYEKAKKIHRSIDRDYVEKSKLVRNDIDRDDLQKQIDKEFWWNYNTRIMSKISPQWTLDPRYLNMVDNLSLNVAKILIEWGLSGCLTVIENLWKFKQECHNSIAKLMCEEWYPEMVYDNLNEFADESLGDGVAIHLIECWAWEYLCDNVKKFKPLSKKVAITLEEHWLYDSIDHDVFVRDFDDVIWNVRYKERRRNEEESRD